MDKKKKARQLTLFPKKRRNTPKWKKLGFDRMPTWYDH